MRFCQKPHLLPRFASAPRKSRSRQPNTIAAADDTTPTVTTTSHQPRRRLCKGLLACSEDPRCRAPRAEQCNY